MNRYPTACEHCGKSFSGYRTSRKRFCDDKCRVQYNRAKKKPTNFEKKYNDLAAAMRNSISYFEERAANAEKSSKDKNREIGQKLAAGDMAREYQAVANEIKRLLESSEMTYDERIAAIYDVDPINYD